MTAERNGAESAPEGDDPFAHLYRQEGGDGSAAPPASQPGVPRRSYNQVRNVGERQYGQGQGYGQQQPSAHYAAPETMPGGRAAARQGPPGDSGRGRSRNGLLAGALAVVAAVVIGIGAAVFFNTDDSQAAGSDEAGSSETSNSGGDAGKGGADSAKKNAEKADLPKEDAASLRLDGGTVTAGDVPKSQAKGGTYVSGLNKVGAKVTWNVKAPKAGDYRMKVRYGIPGEDANATVVVNGEPNSQPLGMKNFIGSPKGDWEKGWQTTWAPVTLKQGDNTIEIACAEGNQCNANLDKVSLGRVAAGS